LSAIGVFARQPRFEGCLLGLIHGRQCNDDCSSGVAFGIVRTALQFGFFALRFPLSDFFVRRCLAVLYSLLYVSLRSSHLGTLLLDPLLDSVQVCSDFPIGCLRLAVDFTLECLHVVVDAGELDAKIFTTLIDAFAHNSSPSEGWFSCSNDKMMLAQRRERLTCSWVRKATSSVHVFKTNSKRLRGV
jgi:hypothetical protein